MSIIDQLINNLNVFKTQTYDRLYYIQWSVSRNMTFDIWQNAKTIITGVFFNAFTTFSPTGFFFFRNVVCSLQESSYKFVESSKIRVKKALGTKLHCFYVNIFFWFFFTQSSKSRCLVCTTVITVVKFSVKNYKIRQ